MRAGPVCGVGGLLVAVLLGGCGGNGGDRLEGSLPNATRAIALTVPDAAGGTLAQRVTCDGAGVSPALRWSGVPRGAAELVLVVTDPDAPGGRFVHWTLAGLEPTRTGLRAGERPAGAVEGANSFGDDGYGPPCPPEGDDPHRYVFDLYALSRPSGLEAGAPPDDVVDAVRGALAHGEAQARYGR